MQNDDLRPHLWIPPGEVISVVNKPTARTTPRGVSHPEHGSKLSKGLKKVVDAYESKLMSNDALSDEDIRVFHIALPDGVKLSNQQDFLQGEGLTLNYITDERNAIVSTSKSRFERLSERVAGYRDNNRKRDFQYIDSFDVATAPLKQSYSLRQHIEECGEESVSVDIEMVMLPKLDVEVLARAEKNIIKRVIAAAGELPSEPFTLSDGTRVIRAKIPLASVDEISSDTSICQVIQTSHFSSFSPSALTPIKTSVSLDKTIPLANLPVVAILDSGVLFPPSLEPLVIEHWSPDGVSGGDCVHGTQVAGKAAFMDVGNQIHNEIMIPRARIIDCNICDSVKIPEGELIRRIREAVSLFHNQAKVFNLSYNGERPIDGDSMSLLGFELDALAHQYDIRFVISTGNHELCNVEESLRMILDDTDTRITTPADSMLNIVAGAIAGTAGDGCISNTYETAPYARIGPGFCGFKKPDVVALGANVTKGGKAHIDKFSIMLGKEGAIAQDTGTSFTAPVVAGDLAEILNNLPDNNVLLAQTLLYHGSQHLWTDSSLEADDAGYLGDWYGRGLSSPVTSIFSERKRVTFVHLGVLNRLTKQRVQFWMPSILARSKGNKMYARVIVTCLTQPPIDRTKGENYLGAYAFASLHKIDGKGKDATANPTGNDGRMKWDTCHHFHKDFATFSPGDWAIWIELFTRDEIDNTEDVPYALAVTVEDLDKDSLFDIYTSIQEETKGRFPTLSTVRLPVKGRH